MLGRISIWMDNRLRAIAAVYMGLQQFLPMNLYLLITCPLVDTVDNLMKWLSTFLYIIGHY